MKRKKRRPKTDTSVVVRIVVGLILIALGLILALGAAGLAGLAGGKAFAFTFGIFGVEAIILPIIIVGCGIAVLIKQLLVSPRTVAGALLILIAVLAFLGAIAPTMGGSLGTWMGAELKQLFGFAGTSNTMNE